MSYWKLLVFTGDGTEFVQFDFRTEKGALAAARRIDDAGYAEFGTEIVQVGRPSFTSPGAAARWFQEG